MKKKTKITQFPHYFLKLDTETIEKGYNLLSNQEYRYAKSLAELDEKYFRKCFLDSLPTQIQISKLKHLTPPTDQYVFFVVNRGQPDFAYRDGLDL